MPGKMQGANEAKAKPQKPSHKFKYIRVTQHENYVFRRLEVLIIKSKIYFMLIMKVTHPLLFSRARLSHSLNTVRWPIICLPGPGASHLRV